MRTFLQLCQDACRECGIAQGEKSLFSVEGNSGEVHRIVNWIKQSWTDIQNRHDNWRWMRAGFTLRTAIGEDMYRYDDAVDDETGDVVTLFAHWWVNDPDDPPKAYRVSAGKGTETWLIYADWRAFKRIYRIGVQNDGQPAHITVDPQNRLVLGPRPNDEYVVSGEYQRSAQKLSEDNNTPDMPERFHDLIVWLTVVQYAEYEAANELYQKGLRRSRLMMRQLENDQLPDMRVGSPLA